MKRHTARKRELIIASTLCLLAAPHLQAQSTEKPVATKPAENADDDAIVLSPFEVSATSDADGYQANSTLAGTRVRTDIKDLSSSISVVTSQFLKDTGAKNNQDLLVYTPSTEVAGLRGNFSGAAGAGVYKENTISATTRVRGLDSADNTRDYFLTDIPWDGFNVGRVDLQRGPNSILFGVGSPAGIINTSLNDAAFKNSRNFENRIDEFGSIRNSLDLNQALIPKTLAIRIAGLKDDTKFEQKPAFNNQTRLFAALRYDPELFGPTAHTSIRVKFEDGRVRSNNPRQLPPVDTITPWFQSAVDPLTNRPGINKFYINQFSTANVNPTGVALPGRSGSNLAGIFFENNGFAQGRSYWPDVISYYDTGVSETAFNQITAQPNTNKGLHQSGGINGINMYRPMAIPSYSQYASAPQLDSGFSTGLGYHSAPGGSFYADKVLTDTSIFNFYKNLLDGPNKREWQDWRAFNAVLDQSFMKDRVAFQIAYDRQQYSNGQIGWLAGSNYAINVDVNATLADGSLNGGDKIINATGAKGSDGIGDNVGRAYVGNGASAPGLNSKSSSDRDSLRGTLSAELRASDLLGKTRLAEILGTHNFTGLFERDLNRKQFMNFAEFVTTPDYISDNSQAGRTTNQLSAERGFEWVAYLGGSMLGRSSAAGLNLQGIPWNIRPAANSSTRNFDATWIKSTTPGAADYVDKTAPYTWTDYSNGTTSTGTQVDNPANYKGWTQYNVDWMHYDNPADFDSMVQSLTRSRSRVLSRGATWQAHMFGDTFVPTFGWRRDEVDSSQTNAPKNDQTGYVSQNFTENPYNNHAAGESKSWGFVYKLPEFVNSRLPFDSSIRLFLNHGDNFQVSSSRLNLASQPIPNPKGSTKEYGVNITSFHEKLNLKVAWFETKVKNATLAETSGNSIAGLGEAAYKIPDLTAWSYGWATNLQEGYDNRNTENYGSNYWDYANGSSMPHGTPAEIAAYDAFNKDMHDRITAAWLNNPLPASFFRGYNMSPDMDPTLAKASGRLISGFTAGTYNVVTGAGFPGGSQFGDHQITVDTLSKGVELELTYQPTKNWNIAVNYSKVKAQRDNVDAAAQKFMSEFTGWVNGDAGLIREWWNGGGTFKDDWNSSLVAPFTVKLNEQGHSAPEISPWRLNAVSTYTFNEGKLKGVFAGGALRVEAGRIIGYKYNANFKNVNSDDPNYAKVSAVTHGGLDVDQPYYGETEKHVDLWVGYSRKLTSKVTWRTQLNIRSAFENDHLVTARLNPDGSVALARIVQGMGFQLTNSFDF